jgi:hypothetical protein
MASQAAEQQTTIEQQSCTINQLKVKLASQEAESAELKRRLVHHDDDNSSAAVADSPHSSNQKSQSSSSVRGHQGYSSQKRHKHGTQS